MKSALPMTLLAALTLNAAAMVTAHAQDPSLAPQLLLQSANQTLASIDARQASSLYAQSPQFVRDTVTSEAFVTGITNGRASFGTVTSRQWTSMELVPLQVAENTAPLTCANVSYVAMNADTPVGAEMVSLCLDGQQWRPVGYFNGR